MNRLLRPFAIVIALGLVAYALVVVLVDPDADAVVDDAITDARQAQPARMQVERSRERLRLAARSLAMPPEGPDASVSVSRAPEERAEASVPFGSGEVDEPSARDGFDYAMKRVEKVAKSRRRLSKDEWNKLYREANDAFSALSMVLDAADDGQAAELETAHRRLKQGLRRVRVRGRRFEP